MAKGFGLWFVDLLCTFQDSSNLYLVMEFMQGGDFFAYMEKKNRLSLAETRFYMGELVQAIDAIHQCGFIHRDLKPDNLVLTAQGHLKLLDFGLCTPQIDQDNSYQGLPPAFQEKPGRDALRTACGTPQYMAPEMFLGRACAASDLWALGVISYECLSGSLPFFSQSQDRRRAFQELKTQIINGTNLPHRLTRMQKKQRELGADPKECLAAAQFISKVLCPVERRISTFECRLEEFFQGINFSELQAMTPPFQPRCTSAADASHFDNFPPQPLPDVEDGLNQLNPMPPGPLNPGMPTSSYGHMGMPLQQDLPPPWQPARPTNMADSFAGFQVQLPRTDAVFHQDSGLEAMASYPASPAPLQGEAPGAPSGVVQAELSGPVQVESPSIPSEAVNFAVLSRVTV
eukprot:g6484.t1